MKVRGSFRKADQETEHDSIGRGREAGASSCAPSLIAAGHMVPSEVEHVASTWASLVPPRCHLPRGAWPTTIAARSATLVPTGISIWWGAYVGMKGEILDHGPLAEAGPRIVAARAEARARRGWIMDIYLLRRELPSASAP